jgi:hypothetical protein
VTSDLVFMFASTADNPDQFFQGYFFHHADYVFGDGGFRAFCRARNVERVSREDGCYVQAEKRDGGYYRFSADYHGYKKLFYFWDNGFWIVSNSLYKITKQIRQNGYSLLPNHPQLAAMATEGAFYPSGRGTFFSQLTSFETIVQGVRLCPADCALWIGPSGVRVERFPEEGSDGTYQQQLERFISIWTARLKALAGRRSLQLSCDLTGGLDSRAVLALLLGAIRGSDFGTSDRLRVLCGAGQRVRKDHDVATRICDHFGLSLNGRLVKRPARLNGKSSYGLWKDLCLGTYHPIYFPNMYPTGDTVHLGGGGGESQRPFYERFVGAPTVDTFVARRTRNIGDRSARPGFGDALQQAIDSISYGAPEHVNALTCHYRHFRNRFHGGRDSQYVVKFQPLASKLLDYAAAVAGASRFRNAQMHYDIFYNLESELLDFPFDNWRKRPNRFVRRNITSVTVSALPEGCCFVEDRAPPTEATRKGKETARAVDYLQDEFRLAADLAADFLGSTYVRRAARAMRAAASEGSFPTTIESKRVAVVLAYAMLKG